MYTSVIKSSCMLTGSILYIYIYIYIHTYRQNTTIFISNILAIYYNRHNYVFRPLILAIFRLYMDLSSSSTTYVGCFLGCGERGFLWDGDLVCVSGGYMVWNNIIVVFCRYIHILH